MYLVIYDFTPAPSPNLTLDSKCKATKPSSSLRIQEAKRSVLFVPAQPFHLISTVDCTGDVTPISWFIMAQNPLAEAVLHIEEVDQANTVVATYVKSSSGEKGERIDVVVCHDLFVRLFVCGCRL